MNTHISKSLRAMSLVSALCSLATACRSLQSDQARLLSEADQVPDETPFEKACANRASMSATEKTIFEKMVKHAHPTSDIPTVLAAKPCKDLWKQVKEFKQYVLLEELDLTPLRLMEGLPRVSIDLHSSALPQHLEQLARLDIETLKVAGPADSPLPPNDLRTLLESVAQLKGVRGLQLESLGARDLSGLASMKDVQELSIVDNAVQDLSFLASWDSLESLYAQRNEIKDLAPIQDLFALKQLNVGNNQIASITPLLSLTNLYFVVLSGNKNLTTILAMEHLPNLRFLMLADCGVGNIVPLKDMPLITLDLSGNPIDSIDLLRDSQILDLRMRRTQVLDLKPITTMKSLEKLDIGDTKITVFPPIPADNALHVLKADKTTLQPCTLLAVKKLGFLKLPNAEEIERPEILARRAACGT